VALGLWLAAVGWPALGLTIAVSGGDAGGGTAAALRSGGELFLRSALWALAVAIPAAAAGWVPGRLLGRGLAARWYPAMAALLLAPVCVPSYIVFYAWWQAWPADSALAAWAVRGGHLDVLKAATLWLGLLCWAWPVAAWCVAGFAADVPAQREEMLRLDGAGPLRILRERLRGDGRGLAAAALFVFLSVFNNTTAFDIAQIYTFGYELRVIDNELGAGAVAILRAAWPAVAVGAAGAIAVWLLLGRAHGELPLRPAAPPRGAAVATAALWLASAPLPAALFAANLGSAAGPAAFLALYGGDLARSVLLAAAAGLLAALVACGLAAAWQNHRAWMRRAADAQAVGWLLAALLPGTVMGVALEAAYNRPGLDRAVYAGPAVLLLGCLGRFAFAGAILARWAALREPKALRDLRRLDGAETLPGYVRTAWPRLLAAGGAAFCLVGALSLGEVAVTARVQPPGFPVIAGAVLDAVHYQRPDTVLLGVLSLLAAGLAAGAGAVLLWRGMSRRRGAAGLVAITAAAIMLAGCDSRGGADPQPLRPQRTFGAPGPSLGQFQYPRGIAADPARGLLYIVDKSARVQRFGRDGRAQLQWRMPESAHGKPTGLGVAPGGDVWVADTHYHRVIVYAPDGAERFRFGRYGSGPGEFIYPTHVAFGRDGRVYVSEYGGNERVQVFTPRGEHLSAFGGPGSGPGSYRRPQALAFSADGTELFIADACNHRVVVTDPEGVPRRVIGRPGRGPGELAYPYDVAVLDDGTLLVCEYGNNRIQHFAPDGRPLGCAGEPGDGPGQLRTPWGVVAVPDTVFVLDSGNNRVHVLDP
jgi:DNA-binding beta-propeller fold protein YncE/ABC-type glycerol-3-phosphate transport system permease component